MGMEMKLTSEHDAAMRRHDELVDLIERSNREHDELLAELRKLLREKKDLLDEVCQEQARLDTLEPVPNGGGRYYNGRLG